MREDKREAGVLGREEGCRGGAETLGSYQHEVMSLARIMIKIHLLTQR